MFTLKRFATPVALALIGLGTASNMVYAQAEQDERTTTTKIADLLAAVPAQDSALLVKNIEETQHLGVDGLASLIKGLAAPGKTSNAKLDYAIGGLTMYASGPNRETLRNMAMQSYLKALPLLDDKQNKEFIIEQLMLVGNDEAITGIAPYLTDNFLADPAARTLVKIGSEQAFKALLTGLSAAKGQAAISIAEALGDAGYMPAAGPLSKLANSSDAKMAKVALYSLAKLADPGSLAVMQKAAERAGYKYDNTNAVASFELYLSQLVQKGHKDHAMKAAKNIYNKATAINQIGVRTAALKTLMAADPGIENKYFQEALKGSDPDLRASALAFAAPSLSNGTASRWLQLLSKAKPEAQVDILHVLGREKNESTLSGITALFNSQTPAVKLAAIEAAANIGGASVTADLIKLLPDANKQETDAITTSLLQLKGPGVTQEAAAALSGGKQLPTTAQVALLQVLAARSANSEIQTVYTALKSSDPAVSSAAYKALPDVVIQKDLPRLYSLLNSASDAHAPQVQDAVIAALRSELDNGDQQKKDQIASFVLQQMQSAPADKQALYYRVLASVGGTTALKAVSAAYASGKGSNNSAAALAALSGWSDKEAVNTLLNIARQSKDTGEKQEALKGLLGLVQKTDYPAEERLLLLRDAFQIADNTQEKQTILTSLKEAECFNTLVYAGQFLDNQDLQQAAAHTIMEVALAGKYKGDLICSLLTKTMNVLSGNDSQYQKEAIRKYLEDMQPGAGFVSLFNGKDLTGWKGLVEDPIKRSKMDAATLAAAQKKANMAMLDSWKVIDGELHFMSHGSNLATEKQYGDFVMLVDWKIIDDGKGEGDAGIYLRGTPQVQIWDTSRRNVGAEVGSGGLYNNKIHESKPLVVADNPLGEWNTFKIIMKGDRVTVYLNGILVTDNVILENYWDRSLPIFAKEQIELQAHGSPVVYRDIYIKELPRAKPFELSAEEKQEGYQVLFDGTNMFNWEGNTRDYFIQDGNLVVSPKPGKGSGGNLYTKKEYSDFDYRFEFKLTPGANNGLGIRAPLEGDAAYAGMELQILDNTAPIYKNLHKYQYHGSVYGTIPAKRGYLKPVGEWNQEEVIVKGPKIKVILNGTVILDGDITEARKHGAMDGKKHPGLQRTTGHIGFLGHGSTVYFRNIRIKDLSKK